MKNSFVIIILTAFNLFAGTYSGGSGISADPYQISTTDDLIELSTTSADWGAFFTQTNDIFFNTDSTLVDWDGDGTADWDAQDQLGFTPIGGFAPNFTGTYDGNNHSISNLYSNNSFYIGFFGWTNGAEINNLSIVDADFTGSFFVGGLVAYTVDTDISNCTSSGNIIGMIYVGGLSGFLSDNSNINNSYSSCNVNGETYIGGFTGINTINSSIFRSYCTGNVTRTGGTDSVYVAGFCGYIQNSTIENSYSISKVYQAPDTLWTILDTNKAFVGYDSSGVYANNFFDTDASGQVDGIGATGKTTYEMKDYRTYTDQSTSGLTTAWDFVSNPNDDAANNNYWDMDQDWSINNGYPILSYQTEADNIIAFNGGLGTSGSPFQIDNLTNLMILSLSPQYWDSEYIQTSDIDATATQYWDDDDDNGDGHPYNDVNDLTSAGDNEGLHQTGDYFTVFSGVYNGDYYKISNIYIDRTWIVYTSVFGNTDNCEIRNLGIENCDITGFSSLGGLVGRNQNSTIINCYSTGVVNGTVYVGGGGTYMGGLVGANNNSNIYNSYSTCDVNGSGYIGSFIGSNINNSLISNCYALGDVYYASTYPYGNVGGFCGLNDSSSIEFSYSIAGVFASSGPDPTDKGFVGNEYSTTSYSNNFFDSEASNQNTDTIGAASPKTTAEMKYAATFLESAWDFLDETANGTDDDWGINSTDNYGYPWLEWQGFTNDLNVIPVISTNTVQIIGDSKANSGGDITNEGGSSITAKGLCWNTTGSPTLSDDYTDDGIGNSGYTSLMTGLQVNTQYYVRAYATNSYGTGYGDEKTFIYTAIPTLPEWGLIIFGGLIAFYGIGRIYKS